MDLVSMETPLAAHKDYLGIIFRKCVLALIGAHVENCTFEKGVLDELVLLAEERLLSLCTHLYRIAGMQRRTKPSIGDLALVMFLHNINSIDLEAQMRLTPELEKRRTVAALNTLHFDPELAQIDEKSMVFFEKTDSLAPTKLKRPDNVLPWMPSLPPDHTYLQTASHTSEIRNLWQVRQRLVEEGRLAERALQRLLGDKESASFVRLHDKPKQLHIEAQQRRKRAEQEKLELERKEQEFKQQELVRKAEEEKRKQPEPQKEKEKEPETTEPKDSSKESSKENAAPLKPLKLQLRVSDPSKEVKSKPNDSHIENKPVTTGSSGTGTTGTGTGTTGTGTTTGSTGSTGTSKLALKLTLNKPKKRKEDILGKRPRVDIVALAEKRSANEPEQNTSSNDDDETEQYVNFFAAALASYN